MSARASSPQRSAASLAARRRLRRRRRRIGLAILSVLILCATLYGLRQSAVRISRVEVFGGDPALADVARESLQGSYLGLIPRDSILFFPEGEIRDRILVADKNIAAISIFRSGFSSISIKIDTRVAIGRWCGLGPTTGVEPYCYAFDANGVIFAAFASTTQTINPFILYAQLAASSTEPLGATITGAEKLPSTFDFARQLGALGSPVVSIRIRDGEVSDALKSGTSITYVLGDEQNAYTTLLSAKGNFNLSDGSVDYVDLRFGSKVYLKRKQ